MTISTSTSVDQPAGTLVGHVESGPLTGWEIVATGDGGVIAMRSGSCFHRLSGGFSSDVGWDAVTARLWAKTSDADLSARIEEYGAEAARLYAQGRSTVGADAALEACLAEHGPSDGGAVMLKPGVVYVAFDRFVCSSPSCAGSTARATGRTLDGQRLREVGEADLQEWASYDLGPLKCECGSVVLDAVKS